MVNLLEIINLLNIVNLLRIVSLLQNNSYLFRMLARALHYRLFKHI